MVLNLVSCPRNLSTALMYSFAQYPGMQVIDEPFYGMYLNKTGIIHPGRAEILTSMPLKEKDIYDSIQAASQKSDHLFLKNMSQHMAQIDSLEPMQEWRHIFYIRDPRSVIHSFAKVIPDLTLQDIGFGYMRDWYDLFQPSNPVILDSDELILDPSGTLERLYDDLQLPFDASVLTWSKGPKVYDGVWSKYWYNKVHGSDAFETKSQIDYPILTEYQQNLYEQAVENYLYLKDKKS